MNAHVSSIALQEDSSIFPVPSTPMNTSNTPPTTSNDFTPPLEFNVTFSLPKSDLSWPWFASGHGSQAAWIVLAFVLVILLLCLFGIKYRKLMMSNIREQKSKFLKKKCDSSCLLLDHLKFWKRIPNDTHIKNKEIDFKEYLKDNPLVKSEGINVTPQNDNLWKDSKIAIPDSSSNRSLKPGEILNLKRIEKSKNQTSVTFLPYETYPFASDSLDLQAPSFTSILYNSPIYAKHDDEANSTAHDIISIESDIFSTHSNDYDNIDLGPFAPHASPNDDFEVANVYNLHEMIMEDLSEKIDNRRKLLGDHASNEDITSNNTYSTVELGEKTEAFNEGLVKSVESLVEDRPKYKMLGSKGYNKSSSSKLIRGKAEGKLDSEGISRNPNSKRVSPKTLGAAKSSNFIGNNNFEDVFSAYTGGGRKNLGKSLQLHSASKINSPITIKQYDAMDDMQEVPAVHKDIYPIHHVFDNDLFDLSHENENQAIQARKFLHNYRNLNLEPQVVTKSGFKRSVSSSPTTSSTSRSANLEEFSNVQFKKDMEQEGHKLESEQAEGIKGKSNKSKLNTPITSSTSRSEPVEDSRSVFVAEGRKQEGQNLEAGQTKGLKRKPDISNSSTGMKTRKEDTFEFHAGKNNDYDNPLFQSSDLIQKKLDSSDYTVNGNEVEIPLSLVSTDKEKNLNFLDHRDVFLRRRVSSEQSWAKRKELITMTYESKSTEHEFDSHHENPGTQDEVKEHKVVAHRFKHNDIKNATNRFTTNLKIYKGSYGIFYKGLLPNVNTKIAIKVLSHSTRQRPSLDEISTLSQLEHPHLVKLLGFCKYKLNDYHVVYEWISGGSVDQALFEKKKEEEIIPWEKRFAIIEGVARALEYLHEKKAITHRNVKANNIMFQGEKLGDFGLGWLMEHGSIPNLSFSFTNDTHQWIAPEFILSRKATTKMDVYAFGIFILEVITGRRLRNNNNSKEKSNLISWILDLEDEGKLLEAIDKNLLKSKTDSIMKTQMELVLHLGILCSKLDPKSRPSMKKVNQILKGEISLSCIEEEEFLSSISPPINLFYPKMEVKNIVEEDNNSTEGSNEYIESKAIINHSSASCLLSKITKDHDTSTVEKLHSIAHPSNSLQMIQFSSPDFHPSKLNSSPDAGAYDHDEAQHVSKDCIKPSQSVDYIPYDDHESQYINIFNRSPPSIVHCIDDNYSNSLPVQRSNTISPMTLVPSDSNYSTVHPSSPSLPHQNLSNFDVKSVKPITMLSSPSSNFGSNESPSPSGVNLDNLQSSNAQQPLTPSQNIEIYKGQVSTISPSSLYDPHRDIPNLKSTPVNLDTSDLPSHVNNKEMESILSSSSTFSSDQVPAEPITMEAILVSFNKCEHSEENENSTGSTGYPDPDPVNITVESGPSTSISKSSHESLDAKLAYASSTNPQRVIHTRAPVDNEEDQSNEISASPKRYGEILLSNEPNKRLLSSDFPCTLDTNLSNSNAPTVESVDPTEMFLPSIYHKILNTKQNNYVSSVNSQTMTNLPVSELKYLSSVDSDINDKGYTGGSAMRDSNDENTKTNSERRIIASDFNHPNFLQLAREDISSLRTDFPVNFWLPSFHEGQRFDFDPLLFAAFSSSSNINPSSILPLPLLYSRSFEHGRSFPSPLSTIDSNNVREMQEMEKQDLVSTEMPSELESSKGVSLTDAFQESEQISSCISSLPTPSLGDNI